MGLPALEDPREDRLARLIDAQSGVIARHQVLGLGYPEADIRRRLRRREWARVHPGVYVDHTGPLTWEQRAWAAVLVHWPAALHRESALTAHGLREGRRDRGRPLEVAVDRDGRPQPPPETPIRVVVDAGRAPRPVTGVSVERVHGAHTWVLRGRPPRVRLEYALLKVAADRDEAGAVAVLADACQQRRTTATRLLATLDDLPRLPRRRLLREVLEDVATGAFSVLERRYLRDVERAHGLPRGERQARVHDGRGVVHRDVRYAEQGVNVELDGRLGHDLARDRWADLDRDLAAATSGDLTVRLGWRQVLMPCRVAASLARILAARGWEGRATSCSTCGPRPDR